MAARRRPDARIKADGCARLEAQELAAGVTGVHGVENRLGVRRGELPRGHGGAPRAA